MMKTSYLTTFAMIGLASAYVLKNAPEVMQPKDPIKTEISVPKQIVAEPETDLECLAKNIYYEAAFESLKGKKAIAQVTINRLKTKRWGNTICDVVYAPAQFSWTLKDDNHKPQGKEWIVSQQVAYDFLAKGVTLSVLKDSIMYHADYISPPVWASKKYKVTQIGQHIFYKKAVKI
jgi:spore germination cell wall hydrolase CwlJ-like protein